MYRSVNLNPYKRRVGDCVVRAISAATGKEWAEVYTGVCVKGCELTDMPSANHVWGAYLHEKGFIRRALPNTCPDCYTVRDFAEEHPAGTYILALSGHVVCVRDGDWLDTWDSGDGIPLYYWERND